jgi:hypothetical protein
VGPPSEPHEAFWLPARLRPLTRSAQWEVHHVLRGREVGEGEGVAVRWPRLSREQWEELLRELEGARVPAGPELLERWHAAFERVTERLATRADVLESISRYTGYPVEMFLLAFGRTSMVHIEAIARTLDGPPTWACARRWQPMPGDLDGLVRFYPGRAGDRLGSAFRGTAPLYAPAEPVDLAVGFAAGNIPGNGLILGLLLQLATSLAVGGTGGPLPAGRTLENRAPESRAPAVLVRNSRQAPLMSPWVLSAVEEEDPELVAGIAMLIWDYGDQALQERLLRDAGLVVAAASDQTIEDIAKGLRESGSSARFHAHGHKVSFDVVGREALSGDLDRLARLTALDSALWDQYGCLSARVHFVEKGGRRSADDYGEAVAAALRSLGEEMPRGASPIRMIRRAYEHYKLLEPAGGLRVLSGGDDGFLVVLDPRPWNDFLLRETVNSCVGRVVVVREVEEVAAIPRRYLSRIPAQNLQTLGVAVGKERILELAEASGACGVTALRPLGRASFPQLAYSWDGYLPLDLGSLRPPGHFSTLESADTLAEL